MESKLESDYVNGLRVLIFIPISAFKNKREEGIVIESGSERYSNLSFLISIKTMDCTKQSVVIAAHLNETESSYLPLLWLIS